ncbi:hypothetical protein SAMN04487943_10838 [Gracilibacillus orientalis]|uniref:Uncharacterized protein n=1 Tax=Gracilibacillus orientalis TaxID=334253 RepID=A0A1I4N9R6_9BACI|nr:hypothetical protein [Gracilibacillus orientalis]SFM12020.1 hypothetical protein SAMN04487943_10838 [Gracilibacillus orientalis]
MKKRAKWFGGVFFLIAVAFLLLQVGSLIVQSHYQAEYIDNGLFYIFNIIIVISLGLSLLSILSLKKMGNVILVTIASLIIIANSYLMYQSNQDIKNITSISPDTKQIFSLKKNTNTGEATYYRSYYRILGRPKEALPSPIDKEGDLMWLADDIAVFTYRDKQQQMQQFVGTYGDRKDSSSYSYVGAQIYGQWEDENTAITVNQEGITINRQLFEWDQTQQYGTLAIVLSDNAEAKWTIALGDDFFFDENNAEPPTGEIILYEATTKDTEAISLQYEGNAYSMIQ